MGQMGLTNTFNDMATQVLFVDDNPGDRQLVRLSLSESPHPYRLECADRLSEGLKKLEQQRTDILLLDLNLPDSQGSVTLQKVINHAPHIPILVLTGADDDALAIEAVRNGAQDYIVKRQLDSHLLTRAMRYAMERHQVLMTLRESRKNELEFKDNFLSHVSHELRSPLASIHQYAEVMLDGLAGPLTPKEREYLGTVLRNAKQLNGLINDLLDAARADVGKLTIEPARVSSCQLVEQILMIFAPRAKAKGISLIAKIDSNVPPILADFGRIQQVLTNLVENSLKFTNTGGQITLRAEIFPDDPNFVRFSVADNGVGITRENLTKIFDRLHQERSAVSNRQGLGLGLAISKELVERHGGRIWADSDLNQGTKLSFLVPMFSLAKLISQTSVSTDGVGPVTLVGIEISCSGKPETWEFTRRRCREVVERCILPDKDVLLPTMCAPRKREIFFVLASADSRGASVLESRIKGQLKAAPHLANSCISKTFCKPLPAIPDEIADSQSQLAWISAEIEAAVAEACGG